MTGGVSILTVIGTIFVVLKLVGVIDWSWLWVLAPFWIPLSLALVVIALAFIVLLVVAIVKWAKENL